MRNSQSPRNCQPLARALRLRNRPDMAETVSLPSADRVRNGTSHGTETLHHSPEHGETARTRDWRGVSYLPELRLESDARINPYNRIWHSDTSWAQAPAQYTALYALEAAPDCASTELADVAAGYATLPEARAREIASWRAFHHVVRARRTRFRHIEPALPGTRDLYCPANY